MTCLECDFKYDSSTPINKNPDVCYWYASPECPRCSDEIGLTSFFSDIINMFKIYVPVSKVKYPRRVLPLSVRQNVFKELMDEKLPHYRLVMDKLPYLWNYRRFSIKAKIKRVICLVLAHQAVISKIVIKGKKSYTSIPVIIPLVVKSKSSYNYAPCIEKLYQTREYMEVKYLKKYMKNYIKYLDSVKNIGGDAFSLALSNDNEYRNNRYKAIFGTERF
jgi:hypothetical protein